MVDWEGSSMDGQDAWRRERIDLKKRFSKSALDLMFRKMSN